MQGREHAAAARGRGEHRTGEEGGRERADGEQCRRYERVGGDALARGKPGKQQRRGAEGPEGQRLERTGLLGVPEGEHEQAEAGGRGTGPRKVKRAPTVAATTLTQDSRREGERQRARRER